ncbi:MAG: hypothetical protein ABIS07_03300 [Dokdonella sp.]
MLRTTLWHEPGEFQCYVRDPGARRASGRDVVEDMRSKGIAVRPGFIAIRLLSEFSNIPITVEYDARGLADSDFERWDHVVECALETDSARLVFEGCGDAEPFGVLEVPSGAYRVRIHYGGQRKVLDDGATEDFYLIQVWPGASTEFSVLKGPDHWPRASA